ncbi:glycosyltransferase [Kocuria tytonis]|uniref:D-inositol 3-phosphate glycosyltransferase n=1 Tax=Kocuria tytonis TaxID=2054280 RepID=A0A495A2P3_9MICC|nr:glycosyltransferase [Kocuria tytonis]RKQ33633.1 glycosyltransferase [Kocuria tytonis]
MRILVVTTWYPSPEDPGATPFVPRHVAAINRDHDVHVVHVRLMSGAAVTEEVFNGVRVTRVGFDPRKPLSMVRAVREIRRWANFSDVVHTMAFSSALVAAPAVFGRPWVHTEHWNGVLYPDTVNRWWERAAWLRHVLRLPTLVTGVSSLMNETLTAFARTGRVRALGNVVDFGGSPERAPRNPDEIELVSVGSLIPRKGPLVAVETVSWLRERGVRASLTWDGTGPLLQTCEELAASLGVAPFVTFNGFREPAGVQQDLARADVFVLPTKSETFCVAAAEALAAGCPVVMGDRGGQRDFVTDSNGRLVHTRSAQDYARAVMEVVDGEGMASPQELAREIRARYGVDAVVEQLNALYEEARSLARVGAR